MFADERKLRILKFIIDDYILTGIPVGSRTIAKKYETNLSSATIRNEMSDLEEQGFLEQPHVSAGRIPSPKAYRLYVNYLLQAEKIPDADAEYIKGYLNSRMKHMEEVIDNAVKAISMLTNYTSVIVSPKEQAMTIRNIQLVQVSSNTALMVIITEEGLIKNTVFRIHDSIDSDTLYSVSCALTKALAGQKLYDLQEALSGIKNDMYHQRQLIETLISVSEDIKTQSSRISVGGGSKILNYPEYADASKAQSFLSLIETKERLAKLLSSHGEMAFTVRIGAETGIKDMKDLSIVSAAFSLGKDTKGSIGVIGPTRMHYSKVLAILGAMGDHLSQIFNENRNLEDEV